jgi:hypothetical protein
MIPVFFEWINIKVISKYHPACLLPPPAFGVPLLEKEGSFLGNFAFIPLLLQGGGGRQRLTGWYFS